MIDIQLAKKYGPVVAVVVVIIIIIALIVYRKFYSKKEEIEEEDEITPAQKKLFKKLDKSFKAGTMTPEKFQKWTKGSISMDTYMMLDQKYSKGDDVSIEDYEFN